MQAIHTNIEKKIFKNATQLMQEDECILTHHSLNMQGKFFIMKKPQKDGASHGLLSSSHGCYLLILDVGNGGFSEMFPVLAVDRKDGPGYGWDRSDESWGSIIYHFQKRI